MLARLAGYSDELASGGAPGKEHHKEQLLTISSLAKNAARRSSAILGKEKDAGIGRSRKTSFSKVTPSKMVNNNKNVVSPVPATATPRPLAGAGAAAGADATSSPGDSLPPVHDPAAHMFEPALYMDVMAHLKLWELANSRVNAGDKS